MSNLTAYEWPGLDMFPFFERAQDADILKNDFFTNASNSPNPRHFFGAMILWMANMFGIHYYKILLVFKVLHNLFVPVFFVLLIARVLEVRLGELSIAGWLLLALLSLYAGNLTVDSWMSVAWWPPLTQVVSPQTVTQLLMMAGLVLFTYTKRTIFEYLGCVLLVLGGLIHPIIGLVTSVFFVLLMWGIKPWGKSLMVLFFGAALPTIASLVLYRTSVHLSGEELQRYYAWLHLGHYIPSKYHSLGSLAWWQSFVAVFSISASLCYLLKRANATVWVPMVLLSLAYLVSLVSQYLLVEAFPISQVIKIGPSRFLQFGYWTMLLGAIAYLQVVLAKYKWSLPVKVERLVGQWSSSALTFGIAATVLISLLYLLPRKADDPWKQLGSEPIYQFFAQQTPKDAVVCAPPDQLRINLPIISHRAVMCCNGFPFSEDYMAEHYRRFTSIYGTEEHLFNSKEPDLLTNAKSWYLKHNRASLKKALTGYKVDYVVVYTEMASQFEGLAPVYKDSKFLVYNKSDL